MSKFLTRESKKAQAYDSPYWETKFGANAEQDSEVWTELVWKLDVGAECNRLLEHAINLEESNLTCQLTSQLINDLRSIVARVAAFESLDQETP